MPPPQPRAIAFIDGQNLFRSAKDTFGSRYPDTDFQLLARRVCGIKDWDLVQTRFYIGLPEVTEDAFWHNFWMEKLGHMYIDGVWTYSRPLAYRNQTFQIPGYGTASRRIAAEKGIDVRLALDVASLAWRRAYDIAVIFSQDQDLSEAADELREVARHQNRQIRVASAFPVGPAAVNPRGIEHTEWIGIERSTYESAFDPRDYRRGTPPREPG